MKIARTICITILTYCISANVWGAHWVEHFNGSSNEYRLVRQDKPIPLRPLMLLQTGDELLVLTETGKLTLVRDDDSQVILTPGDAPFRVPAQAEPPDLMHNLLAWGQNWWQGRKLKTLEAITAASRGEPPILPLATSYQGNKLLSTKSPLIMRWVGGEAPFHTILLDAEEQEIARQENITEITIRFEGTDKDINVRTARFYGLDLAPGNYILEIRDMRSAFFVDLTVVPTAERPYFIEELLNAPAPESIRWAYIAMRLTELPQWRFQALQIVDTRGLDALAEVILTHN